FRSSRSLRVRQADAAHFPAHVRTTTVMWLAVRSLIENVNPNRPALVADKRNDRRRRISLQPVVDKQEHRTAVNDRDIQDVPQIAPDFSARFAHAVVGREQSVQPMLLNRGMTATSE